MGLFSVSAEAYLLSNNSDRRTEKEVSEINQQLQKGDKELLSCLQDLPYLNPKYKLNS